MLNEKEVSLLYETLLSAPGMNDVVKLNLKMPRKTVLLLAKVIEKGLQKKPGEVMEGVMQAAGDSNLDSLQQISSELLSKAGLSEMNDRLHTLQPPTKEK